jgi:molybdate transport system substrate-binding protein
MRTLGSRAAAAALTLAALAGCGSSTAPAAVPPGGSGVPALTGTVTVLAASSLTGSFTELARRFEAAHPGTTVRLSFGASSALAAQVVNGVDVDVSATAARPRWPPSRTRAAGTPEVFRTGRYRHPRPKAPT